jgi:hypothetical protein
MSTVAQHTDPVDAANMHDWEADRRSRVGCGLLFWCWYLPADELQIPVRLKATMRRLTRVRALMQYAWYRAPARQVVARVPVRPR